jgi:hypothetical protein
MVISDKEIEAFVGQNDDFAFEMRVGAILGKVKGLEVQHGGTYLDPNLKKHRQFDFRCWLNQKSARWAVALECKNLVPDSPLIVVGTERRRHEAFHQVVCSWRIQDVGEETPPVRSRTLSSKPGSSYYREGAFVGKSLLRARVEVEVDKQKQKQELLVPLGDKDVYDRYSQAICSAVELAEQSSRCAKPGEDILTAVLPLVVFPDDSLWEVSFSPDGSQSKAQRVTRCEYFLGPEFEIGKGQNFVFSHVHFVTVGALQSFLEGFDRSNFLQSWFDRGILQG